MLVLASLFSRLRWHSSRSPGTGELVIVALKNGGKAYAWPSDREFFGGTVLVPALTLFYTQGDDVRR